MTEAEQNQRLTQIETNQKQTDIVLQDHITESEKTWKVFQRQMDNIGGKLHTVSNILMMLEERTSEQAEYVSQIDTQLTQLETKVDELLALFHAHDDRTV